MMIHVNYLAVLLAGVASMVVGYLWYSPMLFAKPWMKLMGHTKETMKAGQKEMGRMYMLSFVASLITAFILSHVLTLSLNFFKTSPLQVALTSSFWMWLGFVAPVQMTDIMFSGRKWDLFFINTGYQLVSLLAMGVVLGLLY